MKFTGRLTKANKELRKERNALNLQSEQGKKRWAEINALLDQNTEKIKNSVSALEKQKINIGNYKSALDNIIPGLGGFIDKTTSGTKASDIMNYSNRELTEFKDKLKKEIHALYYRKLSVTRIEILELIDSL